MLGRINSACNSASGIEQPFFTECSLSPKSDSCAEAEFLRIVLYYYSLIYECGTDPVRFCLRQDPLRNDADCQDTYRAIHAIRTFCVHSLGDGDHDHELKGRTRLFFRRSVGQEFPTTEAHWKEASAAIEGACKSLLVSILEFLESLGTDSSFDSMRAELRSSLVGGVSRVDCERVASECLSACMRTDIALGPFVDRNYSKWREVLLQKAPTISLVSELTALIEIDMRKIPFPLPIKTPELIEKLDLRGRQIQLVVDEQRRLFETGISEQDALWEGVLAFVSNGFAPRSSVDATTPIEGATGGTFY